MRTPAGGTLLVDRVWDGERFASDIPTVILDMMTVFQKNFSSFGEDSRFSWLREFGRGESVMDNVWQASFGASDEALRKASRRAFTLSPGVDMIIH